MLFNFGQPANGVIQHAYVVKKLDAAIENFTRTIHAGPWFLIERWQGEDPIYRGRPSHAAIRVAMGFSGHILYELIEPLDREPSVYKELIDTRGFGFHHFAQGSPDYEADVKRYRTAGYDLAFQARVAPGAGRVAYMDTCNDLPGFVEIIENHPSMEASFGRFYAASVGWDGRDPLRPFF